MYALFMWSRYYPRGGTNDLIGTYSSPNEALEAAAGHRDYNDRYEIVDSSFSTIYSGDTNEL